MNLFQFFLINLNAVCIFVFILFLLIHFRIISIDVTHVPKLLPEELPELVPEQVLELLPELLPEWEPRHYSEGLEQVD